MSYSFNTSKLLSQMSTLIQAEADDFTLKLKEIQEINDMNIKKLEESHQKELDKVLLRSADEIEKLEAKVTASLKVNDTNKFQARTILSLTSEISEMQANISSLEKKLKDAVSEIRDLTQRLKIAQAQRDADLNSETHAGSVFKSSQAGTLGKPESTGKAETLGKPESTGKAETLGKTESIKTSEIPENQTCNATTGLSENEKAENEGPDEDSPEVVMIGLKSGTYFCNIETGELYEYIDDETIGEFTMTLKSIKIKQKIYYLDTSDNNFYIKLDTNEVGDHAGQIINSKAIFNKKP